jgi:OFA family oxalate/formate antiporter-like MFS transporter
MKNRWIILAAGILIQTILGGIYAWSVFVPSLVENYNIGGGQSGSIFGTCIAVFTVSMIFAGRLLSRKGPRLTAMIGAVFFGAGYLTASLSQGNFLVLMVGIGLLSGIGIGFGYVCPLTIGMQWFPKRKGLVSGLAVAGFGGGAILLSSVAAACLSQGMDVLVFFRWMGFCLGGTLIIASLLLASPDGQTKKAALQGDWEHMRTAPFIISTLGIFSGTFAGLLVIGHLTPMAEQMGMSLLLAAESVSVFAIGNAIGRIAWGHGFDRIGVKAIPLSLGGFAAALILFSISRTPWLFLLATGLLGFGFGANFVVYASNLSACFGTDAFPRLYPYCFLGYGIAGLTGPPLGGLLAEHTGSYLAPLLVSITILLAGTALTTLYTKRTQHTA